MTATAFGVSLDELRDLFTGVPAEDGEWSSSPFYSVRLAVEIARRCDCVSESMLRQTLYDDTIVDEIPNVALEAIKLAVVRYRAMRTMQNGGRGL